MPELSDEAIIRLLAEKVMGWKYYRQHLAVKLRPTDSWLAENGFECVETPESVEHIGWSEGKTFEPLTDIAHAFMVVEKMRMGGHSYRITESGTSGECFACRITVPVPRPGHHVVATGETAARAICFAAIAATEERYSNA